MCSSKSSHQRKEKLCKVCSSAKPPYFYYYSQNHVKCSRPLCSLPGLQGQKIFADAIINFLIPLKSISDKNSYDHLFINEVVKIFTFQFDESVIKFYLVKVFQIFMKFWYVVLKYHKFLLVGTRKKILQSIFQEVEKTEKWPFLASISKSKLNFHAYGVGIQKFYEFTNLNSR